MRYTPTCVGKTKRSTSRSSRLKVHPHMRGENLDFAPNIITSIGTPPHAWGKPQNCQSADRTRRYTPTCVGKTAVFSSSQNKMTVHPHMRGENVERRTPVALYLGTPPHAWGKLTGCKDPPAENRYTPTCVGKTLYCQRLVVTISVHPHMRGENSISANFPASKTGTPPHAWGKHSP